MDNADPHASSIPGFDGSFEGTRQRQILLGLTLEPVERLRWLEQTMAELRALQGRAAAVESGPK